MHNEEGSNDAQKCEGGDPTSPGITATASADLRGPRAYKYNETCFFPIIRYSKGHKLLLSSIYGH